MKRAWRSLRTVLTACVIVLVGCASPDAARRDELFQPTAQQVEPAPDHPPASLPVQVLKPQVNAGDLLRVLHRFAAARSGDEASREVLDWARQSIAFDVAYMHVSLDAVRTMVADGRGDKATVDGILTRALGELQRPVSSQLQQVLTQYLLLLAVGAAHRPWNDKEEVRRGIEEFQRSDCTVRPATDEESQWGAQRLDLPPTPEGVAPELTRQIEPIRERAREAAAFSVIDCGFGRTLLVATVGRMGDAHLVPISE